MVAINYSIIHSMATDSERAVKVPGVLMVLSSKETTLTLVTSYTHTVANSTHASIQVEKSFL